MNYHNITKDDMLNGDGLRVVLWVAGCSHNCPGCQNPITHNPNGGILFDDAAMNEIREQLSHDYIAGITLSGGDPLHEANRKEISNIVTMVKNEYPTKTIWLYSGYTWEKVLEDQSLYNIVSKVDVFCDGPYVAAKRNLNAQWVGSDNQRVINVKETLEKECICLHSC